MSPVTKFRTCFIIFILLLSSLSIFAFAPEIAKAQDSAGGTFLYFHDYFGSGEEMPMINQSPPSKDNDSMWPPSISNTEEWLYWFTTWLAYKEFEGFDDSELYGLDELNPFTLTEDYYYEGQDNLEIKGAVTFDLYFSSTLLSKILKDSVDVSITYIGSDSYEEIGNKTVEIKSSLSGGKIQQQEIKIEDVTCNLKPGDILEFSIKLIQTDKPIGTVIKMQDEEELMGIAEQLADTLITQNILPKLKDVGEAIKEVLNSSESEGINITMDDIAELANAAVSSSFVYDSIEHRSSVTLPVAILGEEENTKTYYLHDENIMNEELPTKDKASQLDLKKGSPKWDGPVLERSKALTEATASLYIDHIDLIRLLNIIKGKIKVTATLLYGDSQIASSEEELGRTTLLGLLQKPKEPMMFTFRNITDKEIEYGTGLSLEVSAKGTKFGFLGLRRNAKLLYDSTNYPSSLTVKFGESNHIKILEDSSDKKVALGGSVNYNLTISSDFEESVDITTLGFSQDEKNKWDITIIPEKISILKGGKGNVTIMVKDRKSVV